MSEPNPSTRGVYSIAVAAELSGVGEQTLRLYEKKGLLNPSRSDGGTRRYSDHDITAVHRIVELLLEGLNLAGVHRILELELVNQALRRQLADLTKYAGKPPSR